MSACVILILRSPGSGLFGDAERGRLGEVAGGLTVFLVDSGRPLVFMLRMIAADLTGSLATSACVMGRCTVETAAWKEM